MSSVPALQAPDRAAATLELRKHLRTERDRLHERFRASGAIGQLHDGLTRLTDQVIRDLWNQSALGQDASLIAVGGYGRSELLPGSDIDLLVLVPGHAEPGPGPGCIAVECVGVRGRGNVGHAPIQAPPWGRIRLGRGRSGESAPWGADP